jgi:hypothetical protein
VANGRVFELRSSSKRYPAPCALVIDDNEKRWNGRMCEAIDKFGVIGHSLYERSHNPNIYVPGLRFENFTSARIARRRQDLERFDGDDLALIQYGLALDFSGRIHSNNDIHVPLDIPAEWTVFWLKAFEEHDSYKRVYEMWHHKDLDKLLHGAWHFNNRGGHRHLGYKFGHAWITRHTGARLNQIRQFLRGHLDGLIEQPVKVVRWSDGTNVFTQEIRRECPPLGSRWYSIASPDGSQRRTCT